MKILSIYEMRHCVGELICADCRIGSVDDDELPAGVGKSIPNQVNGSGSYSKDQSASSEHGVKNERGSLSDMNSVQDVSRKSRTASMGEETREYQSSRRSLFMSFSAFDNETAAFCVESDVMRRLGQSSLYIKPVHPVPPPTASAYKLKYNNLVDLCLSGRMLGDNGVEELFRVLGTGDYVQRLRVLELQNNKIGDRYDKEYNP
jgi:hypothetical protein